MTVNALLYVAKFNFFLTIVNVIVIVCVAEYILVSPNIMVYWGSTTFSYGFTMLCIGIVIQGARIFYKRISSNFSLTLLNNGKKNI